MVSCSDKECHFIPHFISSPIIPTVELGANDKNEKAWDGKIEYLPNSKGKLSRRNSGTIIKDICISLKVDRLGNISKASSLKGYSPDGNTLRSYGNKVSEPDTIYSIYKKLTVSSSFDEASDAQLSYWAELTPEQRFEGFNELMNRFYNFIKPTWAGTKIIVDQ